MARRCGVCSHPDRRDIDSILIEGGVSLRGVSRKYLVSEDSLSRHRRNHLPKIAIQEATESRETDHHQKLARLERVLYTVLLARLKDEDHSLVPRVHASLLRNMEFELRLADVEDVKREIEQLKEALHEREDIR